ncbi:MAG: pesticin C-terminus-like muramidase [Treponema sp.]|nr:pesticin C-terminus-like muramidase [Treponema sp.]
MIHKDYICAVLERFEGKGIETGYVPCKGGNYRGIGNWENKVVYGASGVTIGTGVDLGQQTQSGLLAMGVPQALLAKLVPYLGLKREAALKKLFELPLKLTPAEVNILDAAVKTKYINTAAALFGGTFGNAPKQVQAVAVSIHYQFGTPFRAESPSLGLAWKALQTGDYKKAAGFLRELDGWSMNHRQYMVRRRAEADILDKIGRE